MKPIKCWGKVAGIISFGLLGVGVGVMSMLFSYWSIINRWLANGWVWWNLPKEILKWFGPLPVLNHWRLLSTKQFLPRNRWPNQRAITTVKLPVTLLGWILSIGEIFHQYCWWLKSCTTWDVWNPINNGINYYTNLNWWPPDSSHQQYHAGS